MLVTDNLVFVHLHKSGGTFVNQLLLRHSAGARQIGYHLPYRELPAAYLDRPVLGTVRDPYGYYVSWYHFQKGMARPNALFRICSDGGRLDFGETIRALVRLDSDHDRLARLEQEVPDGYQRHGLNLTKRCVRDLRGCGLGFYGFLYRRMFDGAVEPTLLPTHLIRQELTTMLESLNEPVTDGAVAFIRDVPDLNASEHTDVERYFDETLRAEVRERDAIVFEKLRSLELEFARTEGATATFGGDARPEAS